MDFYLERFGSIPGQGTFGQMYIEDLKVCTVEREDLNNKRGVSCIPAGVYDLIPHVRPNKDKVYAVVNEELGVYQYPHEAAKRDLILIHVANTMNDIQGCIAPGSVHSIVKGKLGVINSGDTMKKIIQLLGREETHKLHIVWRNY